MRVNVLLFAIAFVPSWSVLAQPSLPLLTASNGRQLGVVHALEFSGSGFEAWVAIERGGRTFPLRVFSGGNVDGTDLGLYYETTDCTGPAFFNDNLAVFEGLTYASVDNPPDVIRVAGEPSGKLDYQSVAQAGGPCSAKTGSLEGTRPVVEVFDFSAEYPSPFFYSIGERTGVVNAVPANSPVSLAVLAALLGLAALLFMRKRSQ